MDYKDREMCIWFLSNYADFRYFELSETAFDYLSFEMEQKGISVGLCAACMEDEKRCMELARKKWKASRSADMGRLLSIMDGALQRFKDSANEKQTRILVVSHFSMESFSVQAKEQAKSLQISIARYYTLKAAAEDLYCRKLLEFAEERNFSLHQAYEKLKRKIRDHEPGERLYENSLVVLKKYMAVKKHAVLEKAKERQCGTSARNAVEQASYLLGGDILARWMHSSMMENTYIEILFIDETIRRMRQISREGRMYADILSVMYTDERYEMFDRAEKIEKLGMTDRVFYSRRKKAVMMFSKILWGSTGYRA